VWLEIRFFPYSFSSKTFISISYSVEIKFPMRCTYFWTSYREIEDPSFNIVHTLLLLQCCCCMCGMVSNPSFYTHSLCRLVSISFPHLSLSKKDDTYSYTSYTILWCENRYFLPHFYRKTSIVLESVCNIRSLLRVNSKRVYPYTRR